MFIENNDKRNPKDSGYVDKAEYLGSGLTWEDSNENPTIVQDSLILVDSRNCVGLRSFSALQEDLVNSGFENSFFVFGPINGYITNTSEKGEPGWVKLQIPNANIFLLEDQKVYISGVRGNTILNGQQIVLRTQQQNANGVLFLKVYLKNIIGNGNYEGGGFFIYYGLRYPQIPEGSSIITGNQMIIPLNKELHNLKSLSIEYMSIPRDIIPLTTYIPDLITWCTNTNDNPLIQYPSSIPITKDYIDRFVIGFYYTPLDIFRQYIKGAFSMPDPYTPPPLQLWDPPQGDWPTGQPKPYPYQTVPTYISNTFKLVVVPQTGGNNVQVSPDDFYLIFSGYGVLDLADFTVFGSEEETTEIRRAILKIISPIYYLKGYYYTYIMDSEIPLTGKWNGSEYENAHEDEFYGFGCLQRFVPMPGTGMSYQPAVQYPPDPSKGRVSDPTVVSDLSPIPFPNFRGNVWGPYDGPGARFQKMSLRDTLQDLFLNGDTINLLGVSIIKNDFEFSDFQKVIYPFFSPVGDIGYSNVNNLYSINFENLSNTTNPNILNAMRINPNGFGAVSQKITTQSDIDFKYKNASGMGPSTSGPPSGWANNPVNSDTGVGTFSDPIAAGPEPNEASGNGLPANTIPQTTDASYIGNGQSPTIPNRRAWSDLGPNGGDFINQISKYSGYLINTCPDSELIIHIQQAPRDTRNLYSNPNSKGCIAQIPVRLTPGLPSGTNKYVEAVDTVVGDSSRYWTKEFNPLLGSLDKLNISFTTFEGEEIILEKMLQPRVGYYNPIDIRGRDYLKKNISAEISDQDKRIISFIIKAQTYQPRNPGLLNSIKSMLKKIFGF